MELLTGGAQATWRPATRTGPTSRRRTAPVVENGASGRAILRCVNRRYGAGEDVRSENTAVRVDAGSTNYWTDD